MSSNVRVCGAVYSAESCSYDPVRNLIGVPSRGVGQNVQANDAWVSLLNHDGSVHTARWIGVQNPGDPRASLMPPLVMNEPLGSDIIGNVRYLADRDGGTNPNDPLISVVRKFNMQTGAPAGEVRIEKSTGFSDIEVAEDGTIYATQTGADGQNPDASTWRVWRITPAGVAAIFAGRAAAAAQRDRVRPAGNIVVVNIGNNEVLTFSPAGRTGSRPTIRTIGTARRSSCGRFSRTSGPP